MIKLAYFLVAIGFLFAAYQASLDPETVDWRLFGPAMLTGLVGVVLLRRAKKAAAHSEEAIAMGRQALSASLHVIVEHASQLEARRSQIAPETLPAEIDKLLRADLTRFADARETMIPMFGLKTYAAVMDAFASGERYINRVWSASTDGYYDEAALYLSRAVERFKAADDLFRKAAAA